MEKHGTIIKVSGPLVVASGMEDVQVYDVVKVSHKKLMGEVIELRKDLASIQVYEETAGIGPGEPVYYTYQPLSVALGPGLIEGVFDGILRPLDKIYEQAGAHIPSGIDIAALDNKKKWLFKPVKKVGDFVKGGQMIGYVDETTVVRHKIMVPPNIAGKLVYLAKEGEYTIEDLIYKLEIDEQTKDFTMVQYWPVRVKRPYSKKLPPVEPMITGQRIIDTLFPIAIGGIAAIPGPFGSGKTVVQQQLAKWADADIIVYVGCGERGNEMTDVLNEFPHLKDPKSNEPLMKRTVLIANTSNMPVAAREASIYTGITISEYFRDMGYKVAIMADSTSRWAEALREMSSRLEEMPGEEGYPAYLGSRLAEFYERAGLVETIGDKTIGAITAIGAVSPPGGDMSEPVAQATLRIVKVYWGLSASLAYKRHFPAIDWLRSYSLYDDVLMDSFDQIRAGWAAQVKLTMALLQEEKALEEIVRLVGIDTLSYSDRVKLLTTQMIREDFLHQNAFDEIDTFTSLDKQYRMLNIILLWHQLASQAVLDNKSFSAIELMKTKQRIGRLKYVVENEFDKVYEQLLNDLQAEFEQLESE
ncbi:MAG: V-type ATP synthase subunit A [Acholeplasmataceae bacterium]|jgi:V/A-type H+-transporting ATPase subunit A|nr:V-type ATP synthase subunit A [Acholeplasmataceae bacterium]